MKKNKIHRFYHLDPERIAAQSPTKGGVGKKNNQVSKIEPNVDKDLRKVLISIVVFTIIIVGLYFLNIKFDLTQYIRLP